MSDDESSAAVGEIPIDERVIETVATESDLDADELADELVVLDAELRGHHSDFEHGDYVTVDSRRAYAVPTADWEAVAATMDFEEPVWDAVTEAHTRQAKLLFDSAVESTQFDSETVGVVVGVDTAEEMV